MLHCNFQNCIALWKLKKNMLTFNNLGNILWDDILILYLEHVNKFQYWGCIKSNCPNTGFNSDLKLKFAAIQKSLISLSGIFSPLRNQQSIQFHIFSYLYGILTDTELHTGCCNILCSFQKDVQHNSCPLLRKWCNHFNDFTIKELCKNYFI